APGPARADGARGPGGQPGPLPRLPQHRRGGAGRSGDEPVIPAPFDYVRARSAEEAIAALAEHGDEAKLLAGGMSLLPLMKLRLATPAVVVAVRRVRDLSDGRGSGAHGAVGAVTRH